MNALESPIVLRIHQRTKKPSTKNTVGEDLNSFWRVKPNKTASFNVTKLTEKGEKNKVEELKGDEWTNVNYRMLCKMVTRMIQEGPEKYRSELVKAGKPRVQNPFIFEIMEIGTVEDLQPKSVVEEEKKPSVPKRGRKSGT